MRIDDVIVAFLVQLLDHFGESVKFGRKYAAYVRIGCEHGIY